MTVEPSRETGPWLVYTTTRHPFSSRPWVGGLSDRLRGIVTCYRIAHSSGRHLLINWNKPFQIERHLAPATFDWRISGLEKTLIAERRYLHFDTCDDAQSLERCIAEASNSDERLIYVSANSLHRTLLGGDSKSGDVELAFKKSFDELFSVRLFPYIAEGKSNLGRSLGVQLRTGGGNGWGDPVMGQPADASKLIDLARQHSERRGIEYDGIYFTSDSQEAKNLARQLGADVFDGPVSHLDRSQDLSLEAFDFIFKEFFTLAKCAAVFSNAGSFGVTAAMVGGRPFERIAIGE